MRRCEPSPADPKLGRAEALRGDTWSLIAADAA